MPYYRQVRQSPAEYEAATFSDADSFYTRNEAVQQCSGCGNVDGNRRLIRPGNGNELYWLRLCLTCERSRNADRRRGQGTRVPRVPGTRLGVNRRFGVELECHVPGGTYGASADQIRRSLPIGWKLKGDGSLGNATGIEIVGPALSGETGFQQLREVIDLLVANGATVDRRCGTHVHHEVQDIGRAGLVTFTRSWAANQDLIDWLVSPSRRNSNNHYCQRLTTSELARLSRWQGSNSGLPAERYRTVNLYAFPKYGTVEIRQHQGTLSFRKIEAWIKLTQAMLDAVAGRNTALQASGSLRELFNEVAVDEDAAAFLLGRAMQMGASPATIGMGVAA